MGNALFWDILTQPCNLENKILSYLKRTGPVTEFELVVSLGEKPLIRKTLTSLVERGFLFSTERENERVYFLSKPVDVDEESYSWV